MSAENFFKDKLSAALNDYLTEVKELNLIDRVILGVDSKSGVVRFFNVLTQEIRIQDAKDAKYTELTRLGAVLERAVEPEVTARVSYLNPSQLRKLEENCKNLGMDLDTVTLIP